MLLSDIVLSILIFVLVALTAGNNLSVSSGPLISGRILRKGNGILLAILGYISGFLIEGNFLRNGISLIFPFNNQLLLFIVLSISISIFVIANKKRVPESLSITFTCALVGVSLAYTNHIQTQFIYIVLFWVTATLVSMFASFYLMKFIRNKLYKGNIWKTVSSIKIILIAIAFLTSFTLGANTIGLIYSIIPASSSIEFIIILAIIFGSIFLSLGTLKRISQDLIPVRYANALVSQSISIFLVELATLFSIPLSNTQTLTSGLYGTGLSYKTRLIMRKPALSIILTWVLTAILSLVAGYVATSVLIVH